jgi:hypothetical protein
LPEPEGPNRFERFRSLSTTAEAAPEIRRPQPSARETEAPFAPDEHSALPEPEGPVGSVCPAIHAVARRPRRFRRAPHPAPRRPKPPWLETTLSTPPRSEDLAGSDRAARPSALRRPHQVPRRSEDPFGLRGCPKTSLEMGRVSVPAEIRRARRVGTQLTPLGLPEGILGSPAGALLSEAEAPSIRAPPFVPSEAIAPSETSVLFWDRSPFRAGATLSEAGSFFRTERAVEMAPRASSPSGV